MCRIPIVLSILLLAPFPSWSQITTGEIQDKGGQVFNVKAYGAKGDGHTDDTFAVQAAIDAAGAGATVYFPHGNYCVNGGIAVTQPSVQLTGGSGTYGTGSNLRICNNADVVTLSLEGASETVYRLAIAGRAGISTTSPAVSVSSGASNFSIMSSSIANGYYALKLAGSDGIVAFNDIKNAYGPALVYATGNNHYIRNKIDQVYPVGIPGIHSLPNPLPAWASSTPYNAGNIVVAGGWLLQCKTAGASGGSAPALSTYGIDISDGTAIWRMVAPSTYYGLQLDKRVTVTQVTQGDFTGPFTAGIAITNSAGGNTPQFIEVSSTNFGNTIPNNILASAGTGLYLDSGNTFTTCLQVGCALVSFTGSWVGQSSIVGNTFRSGAIGVDDRSGQALTITGNKFDGLNISAFHVAAGQSLFNFSTNDCSKASGGAWGTNAACVIVDAGASDHYIITNNLTFGATAGIKDNGTGTNKTVIGNQ